MFYWCSEVTLRGFTGDPAFKTHFWKKAPADLFLWRELLSQLAGTGCGSCPGTNSVESSMALLDTEGVACMVFAYLQALKVRCDSQPSFYNNSKQLGNANLMDAALKAYQNL